MIERIGNDGLFGDDPGGYLQFWGWIDIMN